MKVLNLICWFPLKAGPNLPYFILNYGYIFLLVGMSQKYYDLTSFWIFFLTSDNKNDDLMLK